MSSAAKAKPVVSGVGVADADGSEGDGIPGAGDAEPTVGEGDTTGLPLDPQAASSSAAATTIEIGLR